MSSDAIDGTNPYGYARTFTGLYQRDKAGAITGTLATAMQTKVDLDDMKRALEVHRKCMTPTLDLSAIPSVYKAAKDYKAANDYNHLLLNTIEFLENTEEVNGKVLAGHMRHIIAEHFMEELV